MDTPFVSVHMISKEVTNLGVRFLENCFSSLEEAYYPSELVIVDNGSFEPIFDLYETWRPRFKAFDCEMKVIKSTAEDFCTLRNQTLQHTNPKADFFHWIDTDEIYYPEDLDRLKNHDLKEVPDIQFVYCCFYHCMYSPYLIQINTDCLFKNKPKKVTDMKSSKDNIFRFSPKVRWKKEEKVHEHVDMNTLGGKVIVDSGVEYVHVSYTRHQLETWVKWMRYALLEFGNLNCYKKETVTYDAKDVEVGNQFMGQPGYTTRTVDYLRNWRDIFHCLHDRREHCLPFFNDWSVKDHYPAGVLNLLGDCKTEQDWLAYITKLDPPKFELEWIDKFKAVGNWCDTLDWAAEELQKRNWNIYK